MTKLIKKNIFQKDLLTEFIPDLIDFFNEKNMDLPREQAERIAQKIREIQNYQPRVAIFGKTGSGKSSLCNSIFGEDVAAVSDIEACTRTPQEYILRLSGTKSIVLIDMPGVGETEARDIEYSELYASLLPHVDVLLWVVKSDDRALSIDEHIWETCVRAFVATGCPVFIVINQVDKTNPIREWDIDNNRPSPSQQKLIVEKTAALSDAFKVPINEIIPISAIERYNISNLVEAIVFALPNEKKLSFLTAVKEEVISESAQNEAKRGFLEAIGSHIKMAYKWLKPYIPDILRLLAFVLRRAA